MKTTQTLSVRKPVAQAQPAQKQRIERTLVGKNVVLQTRSPTRITGTVVSFDGGWIVINGTEHRWQSDGSLSAPVDFRHLHARADVSSCTSQRWRDVRPLPRQQRPGAT